MGTGRCVGRSQIGGSKKTQGEKSWPRAWFLSRENESCGKIRTKNSKKSRSQEKKVVSILGFHRENESCGKIRTKNSKKEDPKKKKLAPYLVLIGKMNRAEKLEPKIQKKKIPRKKSWPHTWF